MQVMRIPDPSIIKTHGCLAKTQYVLVERDDDNQIIAVHLSPKSNPIQAALLDAHMQMGLNEIGRRFRPYKLITAEHYTVTEEKLTQWRRLWSGDASDIRGFGSVEGMLKRFSDDFQLRDTFCLELTVTVKGKELTLYLHPLDFSFAHRASLSWEARAGWRAFDVGWYKNQPAQ